jgi:hypothetical protein
MPEVYQTNQNTPFPSDPLLDRFFLSPAEKASKERGKKIVKEFYNKQTNNDTSLNYFRLRNARWWELLLWAKGSQKMAEFLDFMNVDSANKAYVNIDMTQVRIAAQFMGTLIESMSKNKTYPCVTAIDDGSTAEKEDRLFEALYRMHNVEDIDKMQQATGMMLEPPNAFVPDDEVSAKVYFELEDRLPKEIKFEKLLNKTQNDIKFERVANRKTLSHLTVLNFGCTKIERCGTGDYTVRVCIPTNMVFNFFENDTSEHEVDMVGEFYNLKVKDAKLRIPGLTEHQWYDLAKYSTTKNVGYFNIMWNDNWAQTTYNQNRPYDDCSILVFDCEINCGEDVYYVEKPDAFGKPSISQKKGIPYQQLTKDGRIIEQEKPEDVEIIKRKKNTWMRGIYAPYGDMMLYWGQPDLIITPYTNTAKPLSSYTINIPNNDGEYVPSLFERGMEVLREYQTTKLKRKQLIAKIKPSGIRIDVESARNLDIGNGDSIAWEEVVRIYDQTGNELWSSKGLDPLQREAPPLSNTVRDESIEKVVGLTSVLASQIQELRQLWGVPQYRDGSDVGDRTPAKLAEGQNQSSYNVTDFILNANSQLWEETFYKLCLLHWNDIVKAEPETEGDMLNSRFDIKVKTKSTEYERQQLEADIQRFSQMPDAQGNPSVTLKDAMFIREIMDEYNYKLATWYLTSTYESNRRKAMEESQKLQQQNQQLQMQSAQQAQQEAARLQQEKIAGEKDMEEFRSTKKKEELLLSGVLAVAAKDETGQLISQFLPAIQQLVPNITVPLALENKTRQDQLVQQAQAQQQQAMMQQQQPEDNEQQEDMQGQQESPEMEQQEMMQGQMQ